MRVRTGVALLLGVVTVAGCTPEPAKETAPPFVFDDSWKAVDAKTLASARDLISAGLNDPVSIQLQRLAPVAGKAGDGICGEINAKNNYGGYVGFRPFLAIPSIKSGVILPSEATDEMKVAFEAMLISECPTWVAYASHEAAVLSALEGDPEVGRSDVPEPVTKLCTFTTDAFESYQHCQQEQSRALKRIAALREGKESREAAGPLFEKCQAAAPALEGGPYKSFVEIYGCMTISTGPFPLSK